MKIKFERVHITNFMSFTDATIELDGNNYVAVKVLTIIQKIMQRVMVVVNQPSLMRYVGL